MRTITKLLVTSAALLTAAPAAALTIVEGFEGAAPKDVPLPILVRPIGTFTGLAGSPFPNVFVASPGYTNFGPGNNPTTTSILTANGDESFDVALSLAARTVSLDIYLNDLGPATLSFFNGATLLDAFDYPADVNNANNFFNQSYTNLTNPITRFTFSSTLGGQLNTGIDNVTISSVPEPGAWAMMIAGFGLAGAALRHRTRRIAIA